MSAPATQATPQDAPGFRAANADATAAPAPDAQRHRQVLNDLIDIGADLARLLHGQAQAQAAQTPQQVTPPTQQAAAQLASQPGAAPPPPNAQPAPAPAPAANPAALVNLASAFDQVARAVRRCILLAQSLDKPAAPAKDPTRERAAARMQIIRKVEDVIQRPCITTGQDCDQEGAEALRAELHECMDAPDLDDDLRGRPVADIIKDICNDLGLDRMPGTRPFGRRTPADVALFCAGAAAPSGARRSGVIQPDAIQPKAGPHGATQGAGPQGHQHGAIRPAPVHPARSLPHDPAEAVAFVLRHGAPDRARRPVAEQPFKASAHKLRSTRPASSGSAAPDVHSRPREPA